MNDMSSLMPSSAYTLFLKEGLEVVAVEVDDTVVVSHVQLVLIVVVRIPPF